MISTHGKNDYTEIFS